MVYVFGQVVDPCVGYFWFEIEMRTDFGCDFRNFSEIFLRNISGARMLILDASHTGDTLL